MKCYNAFDYGPLYAETGKGDERRADPLLVDVMVYDNLDGTYDVTLHDIGDGDELPVDGLYFIGAESYEDAAQAGASWFDVDLLT